MDPALLHPSLRMLDPLVLIVTPEPAQVAALYSRVLKKHSSVSLKVGIQQGLLSYEDYSKLIRNLWIPPSIFQKTHDIPSDTLEKVLSDDPKDGFAVYLMPELWPFLSQDPIQVALTRLTDSVQQDLYKSKMHVFMAPRREVIPNGFEPMFTVIEDKGMTVEQAMDFISQPSLAVIKVNENAAAEVLTGLHYINARRVWAETMTILARSPGEPTGDEVVKLLRECRTTRGL